MRRILTFVILIASFSLAAAFVAVSSARAVTPEKEVFIDQGFFSLGQIKCGGGVVLQEETISELVQVITFFDDLGNATSFQVHVNFFGEITNLATGESHLDRVSFTEFHNLQTGETTITGTTFRFVEVGEGVIFLETGRKIIDEEGNLIFNAGPGDFSKGGIAALCEALA